MHHDHPGTRPSPLFHDSSSSRGRNVLVSQLDRLRYVKKKWHASLCSNLHTIQGSASSRNAVPCTACPRGSWTRRSGRPSFRLLTRSDFGLELSSCLLLVALCCFVAVLRTGFGFDNGNAPVRGRRFVGLCPFRLACAGVVRRPACCVQFIPSPRSFVASFASQQGVSVISWPHSRWSVATLSKDCRCHKPSQFGEWGARGYSRFSSRGGPAKSTPRNVKPP